MPISELSRRDLPLLLNFYVVFLPMLLASVIFGFTRSYKFFFVATALLIWLRIYRRVMRSSGRGILGVILVLLVSISALTFTCRSSNHSNAVRLQGPSRTVPASFFGLHIHHAAGSTPWPPFPVPVWRLWDAEVTWNYLEPQPGQWNFKLLDRYVDLARAHKTEILLTLGYTPAWAASHPDEVSSSGLPGVASHPRDLQTWLDYLRKVALRYRGQIRSYEIWNEANEHGYYSGTVNQMVALARETYRVLKEVDSANVVLCPSGVGRGSNMQWLDDFFSKGGGKYCDVIAYHFYVSPGPPEQMLQIIDDLKRVLKQHGIEKPIWNTESGWAMDKKFADDEERMGYLARAYMLAWVSGIERFYWYAYDNYTWTSLPLTLPDGRTLNAAGRAYMNLQTWLIGRQLEFCATDSDDFWSCRLRCANGSIAWILWASGRYSLRSLPRGCCKRVELHSLDGKVESKDPTKTLFLGSSPVLIEDRTTK